MHMLLPCLLSAQACPGEEVPEYSLYYYILPFLVVDFVFALGFLVGKQQVHYTHILLLLVVSLDSFDLLEQVLCVCSLYARVRSLCVVCVLVVCSLCTLCVYLVWSRSPRIRLHRGW